VPWGAKEIVLFVLFAAFWASATPALLEASGAYGRIYGPEIVKEAREGEGPQRQLARARLLLWSTGLAFLFQLPTGLAAIRMLCGARPSDLGLHARRLGVQVLAGLLLAVPLTVATYALNALVVRLHGAGFVQDHPLTQLGNLGRDSLAPVEWALLVFVAVVAAPVGEELLFRGLLLPWFATRPWAPHVGLLVAFAVGGLSRADALASAWGSRDGPALLRAALPVLVLLALLPAYLAVWLTRRSLLGPALFITAVLFGWVHSAVWPSPVALSLLGLGLGFLAYRTQSLVGPIVVHATFNGAACAVLYFSIQMPEVLK
jgi:membrane protease YdiL (CAAX protease family)